MSHSDTSGDFEIFVPSFSTFIALQNDTKSIMIPVVVAELWQCKRACMENVCFEKMTFKVWSCVSIATTYSESSKINEIWHSVISNINLMLHKKSKIFLSNRWFYSKLQNWHQKQKCILYQQCRELRLDLHWIKQHQLNLAQCNFWQVSYYINEIKPFTVRSTTSSEIKIMI